MESYRYLGDGGYNVTNMVSDIANGFLQACVIILLKNEADEVYVNEYGKLVFGDLLGYTFYWLGLFGLSYTREHGKYSLCYGTESRARDASGNLLHNQVSRWMSSSSSWKGDLQYRYEAIIAYHMKYYPSERLSWTQTFNRHRLQPPPSQSNDSVFGPHYQKAPYAPGSILCDLQHLCSPSRVLVGRVQPWPHRWKWGISWHIGPLVKDVDLSFDRFVIQSTNF